MKAKTRNHNLFNRNMNYYISVVESSTGKNPVSRSVKRKGPFSTYFDYNVSNVMEMALEKLFFSRTF